MANKTNDREFDILDLLLDDDYDDPIFMYDEQNNKVAFEKVAVINLDGFLYFLLSPLDVVDGIDSDEALVFKVLEEDDGNHFMVCEEDEAIVDKVFEEYYRLLDELE